MNSFNYNQIKPSTIEALKAYADDGLEPGDFLYAVLTNDLRGALWRADKENLAALPTIVSYMHYRLPFDSQGNPQKVRSWLIHKAAERAHS